MDPRERNRIIVYPSHIDQQPWSTTGLMPIDTTDGLMEYAEEMAETLQNQPYHYLIEGVGPVVTSSEERRCGGIIVNYYLPGITHLISEAIADTLGMDDYSEQYMLYPNTHKPRTAKQLTNLPAWQPSNLKDY